MRKMIFAITLIALAMTAHAQRTGLDRASLKPPAPAQKPAPPPPQPGVVAPQQEIIATVEPPDNFFAMLTASHSNGRTNPSGRLGLNHKDAVHPWYVLAGYSYSAAAIQHHDNVYVTGNYQFLTCRESSPHAGDAPYLQIESDYSNTLGDSQRFDNYFDAEVTRGKVSLDVLAGWTVYKPKSGSQINDFLPSLSLFYDLGSDRSVTLDYAFNNKVDGETGYDFAFKQKLTKGYAVYVTAYKHNVIAVRLRKDFNAFKLGAASTRGLR